QLVEDYARLRQDFGQTSQQLQQLPLDRAQLAQLEKLADNESRLYALLKAPQRPAAASTALAQGYAQLSEGAQAMLAASNRLTEREIERLQQTAAEGRKTWVYLALAAAAIAFAMAILFAVLIARPIRQLDLAIRRMGTADFTHAIEVNGPQDLRYLGQRLEWLRTRLQELETQQTQFLRHVSHELKTPLTAVREGAELLRDRVGGELSPQQQEIVRIVRENTLNLQKLIEDLLNYHQTRTIEPADRPRIFESFYQGRRAPEGRIKGSGLGLAIAREYALAHGGRIELLDRADGKRGSCFRVWLPLAVAESSAAASTAAPATLQ